MAAAALIAARPLAPGRTPGSLDIQFLRGLGAGAATARATVLRSGRTLTATSVEVADGGGKLAARATIGFVDSAALDERPPMETTAPAVEKAMAWRAPGGAIAPILDTLDPRIGPASDGGMACIITLPWDDPGAAAEAVCFAGDLCVGPPVARAMGDRYVAHPNPDVALRFLPGQVGREVTGIARTEAMAGGLALQTIRVYAGDALIGTGTSMSLLLAP